MSLQKSVSPKALSSRGRVLEEARQIVAEVMGIAVDTVREEHALEADLGCDSLESVEILMEVEEHFGIDATDDVDERIRTVGDIAECVLELVGEE